MTDIDKVKDAFQKALTRKKIYRETVVENCNRKIRSFYRKTIDDICIHYDGLIAPFETLNPEFSVPIPDELFYTSGEVLLFFTKQGFLNVKVEHHSHNGTKSLVLNLS
jgi:hypothetical protein